MTATAGETTDLGQRARRGLVWSALNNIALRAGTLLLGIALARLLVPEQFGVYAVALAVQSVLVGLADMGLGADIVRSQDPERRAPTVAVLGLAWGCALALVMVVTAPAVAAGFDTPEAAPVIALLSVTVVLAGAGVVPWAFLQRRFEQRTLFVVGCVDFLVSSSVTLLLLGTGHGVLSLAWGRVAAQSVVLVLLVRLSGVRLRFAVDREIAGSVIRFGVPVAGANALAWALLNLDNLVIARGATTVALGFYVLAFNMSGWPMTAVGQVVRSISLPLFARVEGARGTDAFARAVGLAWGLAVPAGAGLMALATPVIIVLYGGRWSPAAPILAALAAFGVIRVVFDLAASYLLARGASRDLLVVQVVWFVVLLPALALSVARWGAQGAAWCQLAVAVGVVLPLYLVCTARAGVPVGLLARQAWPPVLAVLPAWALGVLAARTIANPWLALVVGGTAGAATYVALAGGWLREQRARLSTSLSAVAVEEAAGPRTPEAPATAAVSVVIPCHDYARYLPDAIDSALTQRDVDVEVIVVDDASTDDSAEVAAAYAARDPRVRLVRQPRQTGPVATFNRGLAHVRHEFLVRLDADDVLTPGCLARAVEVLRREPTVGLVYGHPIHFSGARPRARERAGGWTVWSGATWLADRCHSGVNVITSPEVVMRMSVVDRVGGQRDLAHTHDMEMWMRIATVADIAYVRGADQAWHREHPGSLSERADDALGLTILEERRAAFDLVFADPVPGVRPDQRLAAAARRALATEAVKRASYEYDRGRAPSRDVAPLIAFALETWPAVRKTRQWRLLQDRIRAGERWEGQRPWLLLPPLRRVVVDARRRRTWHRTGLYSGIEVTRRVPATSGPR